jgi:hypothetical protein
MSWVFTRITAHTASLPGRTGSVEPAIAVKIVVPVSLLERALSRVSQKKRKRTLRGRVPKQLSKPAAGPLLDQTDWVELSEEEQ